MNIKLLLSALIKYIIGFILVFLLIFIPAGSLDYFNGWLFLCLLFIPMFIIGIILMIKNPLLLSKRLNAKEKEENQKLVVALSGIMFISGFIIAGLNYKYQWLNIPKIIVIVASIIFLISYILYFVILNQNEFLSRTIEVQDNQKIIDTGMYSIVRHPMYSITIVMFLSIPLILGSLYSFIIFLIYPLIIMIRIDNEEEILEKNIKEYKNYKNKVKYKILPFIW